MDNNVEKVDLDRVDWKSSREFFESLGKSLDKLDDKDESYNFTWVGKRKSIIEAGAPTNKILRPDMESSKDFDNTKNMLIVGDNLDALKLLQESYLGKIKMIYIDPPYNTGHDFVYHDNFTVKKADFEDDSMDSDGNVIVSEDEYTENSKANGRFHSDWLSMMYPRLKLARNLLTDDGMIFISIDDNEQANLKKVCDEIFGEDNYLNTLVWQRNMTTVMLNKEGFSNCTENILVYKKGASQLTINNDPISDNLVATYNLDDNDGRGKYRTTSLYTNTNGNKKKTLIMPDGSTFEAQWQVTQETLNEYAARGLIVKTKTGYRKKIYLSDSKGNVPLNLLDSSIVGTTKTGTSEVASIFDGRTGYFSYPKPVELIKYLVSKVCDENCIVLDFFAGSGTTGHSVMQLNAEDGGSRRYILCQLDEATDEKSEARKANYETIDQITAERLRRAGEKIKSEHPEADIDTGFRVFRVDGSNENEDIRKPLSQINQSDLFGAIDNIKKDRTPLDLLFGVIYTSALPFDLKLETRKIGENTVYLYGYLDEGTGLVACFDDNISEETIKEIAKLKALTAAFKDSSFTNSAAKINLSEHFRIICPDTKVKVI